MPARRRDHAVDVRREQVEDARAVLVRLQRDERDARAAVAERRVELADERAHPVRVVGAVAQLERRPRAQLEPARRRRARDRALRRRDVERARSEERAGTGERERRVRALVAGGEQAVGDREIARARRAARCAPRAPRRSRGREPRRARRESSPSTTTAPGETTAIFSAEDLLGRVAEQRGVIEADVREPDDARVEHVRRVEAAAEAGLDDRPHRAPASPNARNATAVSASNCVGPSPSSSATPVRGVEHPARPARSKRAGESATPSICTRSSSETMCGER